MERQRHRSCILFGTESSDFVSTRCVTREICSDLARNRVSSFSPLSPFISLPKYFESEWSYGQYRIPSQRPHVSVSTSQRKLSIPEEERCTVAWIKVPLEDADQPSSHKPPQCEYRLVVLTYSGGWYRLAVPYSQAWLQFRWQMSPMRLMAKASAMSRT